MEENRKYSYYACIIGLIGAIVTILMVCVTEILDKP